MPHVVLSLAINKSFVVKVPVVNPYQSYSHTGIQEHYSSHTRGNTLITFR